MRPLFNRIIVKAQLDQRETLNYGTLKLFMPKRNQYNQNGRETQPTLCEVLEVNSDYPHIQKGDLLILGHNSISNPGTQISVEDNVAICSLVIDKWVLGKLSETGELQPLCGNVIAKRMNENIVSSIIIMPDAYKKTAQNRMVILSVSPELTDLYPDDTAIVYQYSDYEIHYSIHGVEMSAVVIYKDNIVGVERTVAKEVQDNK